VPAPQRPLRSISINVDEGDDIGRLRAAFELGADAQWFDLEDHVPRHKLGTARTNIRRLLEEEAGEHTIFVRVNRVSRPEILEDLEAILCPELYGVILPKVQDPNDIVILDHLLALFERKKGMVEGSTLILPLLETAQGNRRAYEIAAASDRVAYIGGCANQHGDPAVSIGYQWTREMRETSYLRQKVLLDARSAGVPYPMSGVWNAATDLDGLGNFAEECRTIGYVGLLVMPIKEHVDLVNKTFTPTQDEIDYWAEITRLMGTASSEVTPDLVVDNQVVPANRARWADVRLALGAAFGVVPSDEKRQLVPQSIGRAAESVRNLVSSPLGQADER
jgi:citrate lyase subunit beta/citryl-CoA lyase